MKKLLPNCPHCLNFLKNEYGDSLARVKGGSSLDRVDLAELMVQANRSDNLLREVGKSEP